MGLFDNISSQKDKDRMNLSAIGPGGQLPDHPGGDKPGGNPLGVMGTLASGLSGLSGMFQNQQNPEQNTPRRLDLNSSSLMPLIDYLRRGNQY